jgi:general secretion pathway protein D
MRKSPLLILNIVILFAGVELLASCSSSVTTSPANSPQAATPQAVSNIAPAPVAAPPAAVETVETPSEPGIEGGIFEGSGFGSGHAKAHAIRKDDATKDLTLNFVNADVHDVVKTVLGDMLGLNYIVAPTVTGTITLKVNEPLPRDAVFPALDAALRLNGDALVSADGLIKVVPANEAPHLAHLVSVMDGRQMTPGFGLQIVQLHYISSEQMQKILAQVMPGSTVVPVEAGGEMLILAGTEDDRAAMMNVIASFDADWLSGMSFGLFPLKEADASVVTRELWDVLGGQSGAMGKVVRLVPFDRLNAILAVSPQPRYLKEMKTWINRLDVNQAPSDRKIWVYRVQNGRAADLSATLQKLLHVQGSQQQDTTIKPVSAPALPFSLENGTPGSPGSLSQPPSRIPPPPTPDSLGSEIGVSTASQAPRIIADETTNSLIVYATKSEFSLIEDVLRKLDITPLQVRIEAVVAEVTLTKDLSYGVQYLFQNHHFGGILTNSSTTSVTSALPGFSAWVMSTNINSILDLLETVTKVDVISSPQLMVLNNQTATLQVGDQVPVATQSAVSVLTPGAPEVNTIQMMDTGVIIKVTPRVNASGMVLMDIAQEVSDVTNTTTSNIDSPTIEERKIASSVAVRDGQTIALGGLITDNRNNTKNGIPGLQDLPVLGPLFGTTSDDGTRTELLALITPRVVRNDNDVREVTEEMRNQMTAIQPLDVSPHR